jgi:hypothetical protein
VLMVKLTDTDAPDIRWGPRSAYATPFMMYDSSVTPDFPGQAGVVFGGKATDVVLPRLVVLISAGVARSNPGGY